VLLWTVGMMNRPLKIRVGEGLQPK